MTSNLHLADILKLSKSDRMIKVRHLYDMLNAQCCKFAPNRDNKSVEESILHYFGRHISKQRMQNKPVRFGSWLKVHYA